MITTSSALSVRNILASLEAVGPGFVRPAEEEAIRQICAVCRGWSTVVHYAFFKAILAAAPQVEKVLILGVYQGRDIAFLNYLSHGLNRPQPLQIVGVDKFADTPCDDWPLEDRQLNWQQAGFGDPPSLELAQGNLRQLGLDAGVSLYQANDEAFLTETTDAFDFIYLDTAHDFQTVVRQCRQTRRLARPGAIIAGDDYSDRLTWGVQRAVAQSFATHHVFADWLWLADPAEWTPSEDSA